MVSFFLWCINFFWCFFNVLIIVLWKLGLFCSNCLNWGNCIINRRDFFLVLIEVVWGMFSIKVNLLKKLLGFKFVSI